MSKLKLFINNFLVYGMGGVINRIIPFIMLPIATQIFPDTSYMGLNELFNTISSFAGAIAMFGMYDAMFRFFFEKDNDDYKKSVCSTAFFFVVINSAIVVVAMIVFRYILSESFLGDKRYSYLVGIAAVGVLVNSLSTMMAAPTRMENKRRVFLITNTVAPILAYAVSITLLMMGYYETALPMGSIISGAGILLVFVVLNRKWFSIRVFDLGKLRKLFTVAIPVVPILFVYWVFNSCDRLMLTHMMSVGATGIYSIGAKLGTISQLIYSAFSGGWQYFAYSTMNDDNQVEVNSGIFEYLLSISAFSTIGICTIVYLLFKLLFEENYLEAYLTTPYLFLAPLLQMLFQVLGSQMTIHRKTWMNTLFLMIATVFNIFANYILIPMFGVEGAAMATLGGYAVAIILSIFFNWKYRYFIIKKRGCISIGILLFYFICWRLFFSDKIILNFIILVPVTAAYIRLYKKEITLLVNMIKMGLKEKTANEGKQNS